MIVGKRKLALFTATALTVAGAAVAQEMSGQKENAEQPGYLDTSLTPEQRAADLVSRMTLEEKAAQMYDKAPAIERLGVERFNWWNEALHGVARAGDATVFPQAIGMAATWDTDLMGEVATIISDEGRAKSRAFAEDGVREMYTGLTFWSPNINIFRDPRWGRGQETYGEDPFLTGSMAVAFVNGLQGNDENYLKTAATVKHYAVHSGPEPSRHRDDYDPTEADLRETYLPAFKMAFDETDVASVMCAYNAVEGAPACGSERLMVDLLRGELGFDGYVVSDCGAIGDFYYNYAHDYVDTRAEAAALAVRMGTDLNCGDGEGNKFDALPDAVEAGLIDEAAVDQAVTRLFKARMRLGEFDPIDDVPYADITADVVASDAHLQLSGEAAKASLVLLKNDGILPLSGDTKVAVVGPNADNWWTLVANYYGFPTAPVTAKEGIEARIGADNVIFAVGSEMAAGIRTDYATVPSSVLFHETEDGAVPGLMATYYDDPDMAGDPAKTEVSDVVDYYWQASPVNGRADDQFGVVWTGMLRPEETGTYRFQTPRFSTTTIDGEEVTRDPVELVAGESYALRIELPVETQWHRPTTDRDGKLAWVNQEDDLETPALAAAEGSDVILFFSGIDANLEGEEMDVEVEGFLGGDRTSLALPQPQLDLLEKLKATGKPIVVVNFSGSAVDLSWADENAEAVVQAFYPGEKAGDAIAGLLFGDYSPSGRLPVTFYRSLDGLPDFGDYSMRNRTYKYYEGDPLYAFGHGLSYTQFDYGKLDTPSRHDAGAPLPVSVEVTNEGDMASREVVQVYLSHTKRANEAVPMRELVAFDVVELAPGETKEMSFDLPSERLGYFGEDGMLITPSGTKAVLSVGGGLPGTDAPSVSRTVRFAKARKD